MKKKILISGATLAFDEKLISKLKRTSNVIVNSINNNVLSIIKNTIFDLILFEIDSKNSSDNKILATLNILYPQVKIIVIDGHPSQIAYAFEHGVIDAFKKPYKRELLVERANIILK